VFTSFVKIVLFIATDVGAALVGVLQSVEFNSGNATNGAPIVAVIGGVLLGVSKLNSPRSWL